MEIILPIDPLPTGESLPENKYQKYTIEWMIRGCYKFFFTD